MILTGILDDLAGCLEFLQRDLALVGEYQNIPVLITHSCNFEVACELYDVSKSGNKSLLEEEVYI